MLVCVVPCCPLEYIYSRGQQGISYMMHFGMLVMCLTCYRMQDKIVAMATT